MLNVLVFAGWGSACALKHAGCTLLTSLRAHQAPIMGWICLTLQNIFICHQYGHTQVLSRRQEWNSARILSQKHLIWFMGAIFYWRGPFDSTDQTGWDDLFSLKLSYIISNNGENICISLWDTTPAGPRNGPVWHVKTFFLWEEVFKQPQPQIIWYWVAYASARAKAY